MTTHQRIPAARASGFTLVELLVTVVVLSVLVGVAGVPAIDNGGQALSQGELFVRDAVATARARAVATRTPHGVAFDPAGDRLAVVAVDGSVATDPLTKGPYVIDFGRPDMPAGLGIQAADFGTTSAAAIFDAQGDPVDGGTVTLAAGSSTLVLTLDEATGFLD